MFRVMLHIAVTKDDLGKPNLTKLDLFGKCSVGQN
jgi:hypothetical protein